MNSKLIDHVSLTQMETACGSLLSELQKIWDEVGEPDKERDIMLHDLERDCLELYRRKVDQANRSRAQLRQAIADSEAEVSIICAALGERTQHIRPSSGNLKMELQAVIPQLEEMRKKKKERMCQFTEVLEQIHIISKELSISSRENPYITVIDEIDLSLKRLEDLKNQLLALQNEKSGRVKQVFDHLNTLNSLCLVLGLDYKLTVSEIHPTLDDSCGAKSISLDTIERLSLAVRRLKDLKIERMQKLQDLAAAMVELWSLMDTPVQEQEKFQNVTCNIAVPENDITLPKTLSLDFINYADAEVQRLQEMKSSKMKEVILKKRLYLEEICRGSHMVVDAYNSLDYLIETIESGAIDPSYLLEQIEIRISAVKEEAYSRKEILDKVEKWMAACEEECWLEEYNRDNNRYNAGRGTHLMLKRAEKARSLVNKIPAMVDFLTSKVKSWEKERGVEFLYDGVSLLSMIDKYCALKLEKEQERQRQRDQKKIQGQLIVEQEALFGSKPSPTKSAKKNLGPLTGGASNKRFSLGGMMLQTPYTDKVAKSSNPLKKASCFKQQVSQNKHQSGVFAQTSGKGDISATSAKKLSSNSLNLQESESKLRRKPLSPISSSLSSKVNSDNIEKTPPIETPKKKISTSNENETPKTMPIPMPKTPSTVSVLMQMAMTPNTCVPPNTEDIEFSFEERRAGFIQGC